VFVVKVNPLAKTLKSAAPDFVRLAPMGDEDDDWRKPSMGPFYARANAEISAVQKALCEWLGAKSLKLVVDWGFLEDVAHHKDEKKGYTPEKMVELAGKLPAKILFPALKDHGWPSPKSLQTVKEGMKDLKKITIEANPSNRERQGRAFQVTSKKGEMVIQAPLEPAAGKTCCDPIHKDISFRDFWSTQSELMKKTGKQSEYVSSSSGDDTPSYSGGSSYGGSSGSTTPSVSSKVCATCSGTKIMECAHCRGAGTFRSSGAFCNPCKGKGSKPCNRCS
jgi:hypothetical protein